MGTSSIESLQIGNDTEHTMSDKYYPNGDEGLFTMVYRFAENDFNDTNDILMFTFSLERDLVDAIIGPQNIISQLDDLAEYQGNLFSTQILITQCSTRNCKFLP